MQDLKILQQQFKKNIIDETMSGEDLPILDNGLGKSLRLSIYQEGYYLRLIECLTEDFPKTLEKISDSTEFIKKFLKEHLSTYTNPAEYSKDFADYISSTKAELSDLAQHEWKKCLCQYAREAMPLDSRELSEVSPEDLLQSQFDFQSYLLLSKVDRQNYILYRFKNDIQEEVITNEKYLILEKLIQKKTIEEIIELSPVQDQDDAVIFELFSFLAAKGLIIGRTSCLKHSTI